jgi:hypothetical protein
MQAVQQLSFFKRVATMLELGTTGICDLSEQKHDSIFTYRLILMMRNA